MITTESSRSHLWFMVILLTIVALFTATSAFAQAIGIDKAPLEILETIASGQSEEIIVLFDDTAVQNEAAEIRSVIGAVHDTDEILEMKKARYDTLKQEIMGILPVGEQEVITDYSHLPMVFMRIDSLSSMQSLLSQPGVLKIFPTCLWHLHFNTACRLLSGRQLQCCTPCSACWLQSCLCSRFCGQ